MSKIQLPKTTYWTTEQGQVINLDDLPKNIKQQIEIYDAIREDLTDIKYQEQVYSLALATKKSLIEQILVRMADAQEQQQADSESVEE